MQTLWDYRYAQRTQRMKSSAIRELLKFAERPDVISFAGGMPAPEVFPIEQFKEACIKVLDENGPASLQYGSTDGYLPLREMIARHTGRYGINITAENVLITSGSQQALDLIGMIFINPGDRILVESPTYVGAIQAWRAYGAEFIPVPFDEHGMRTDELEARLRAGPKFIYVLPNFQNPTGVTLSYERRLKLIELAERYGVPIIEDDPYGQLRYEGEHLPAISVLDSQTRSQNDSYAGNVIYLSTFSKTLAPGIRLAWVIAPPEIITKLMLAKQGADLHTSTFNQMVAHEVAKGGFLNEHVKHIRKVYKERRDVMIETLAEHMPPGIIWTKPEGGLFLWATAPKCVDCQDLFEDAVKEKVAFVPGFSFYAEGGGYNSMRLNFSNADPEHINEGIARLARVMKVHIKQNGG
ncbi:MAG: PLP-dependent aminotransferase family protein [Chloroflexi bacterium]|nr:PLP-dependent aminotransferase family protein [Chloroflexota bacterium]